jgi:DNA-binding protein HU-beta
MTSIGKTELISQVAETKKWNKKEVAAIIDALIETVTEAVSKGDKVTLIGFGSFAPVKRAARVGINPAKGTKMEIPARTVPKFTPSKAFKDMVNN